MEDKNHLSPEDRMQFGRIHPYFKSWLDTRTFLLCKKEDTSSYIKDEEEFRKVFDGEKRKKLLDYKNDILVILNLIVKEYQRHIKWNSERTFNKTYTDDIDNFLQLSGNILTSNNQLQLKITLEGKGKASSVDNHFFVKYVLRSLTAAEFKDDYEKFKSAKSAQNLLRDLIISLDKFLVNEAKYPRVDNQLTADLFNSANIHYHRDFDASYIAQIKDSRSKTLPSS